METTLNRIITLALIVGMIILTALLLTQRTFGSAPSGLPADAKSATSTNITVGTVVASSAIATSTCSARIISTTAQPILVIFSNSANLTPTGSFGNYQPASTTVAYDSGQFGCGNVRIYSYASSLVTVTDIN